MRIITYLSVEQLQPYKDNADSGSPRLAGPERERLLAGIRENGVLLPLFVTRDKNSKDQKDRYLIYTGIDYYEAALELGLKELPCTIFENDLEDDRDMYDFTMQDLFAVINNTFMYFRQYDNELKMASFLIWKLHKYFSEIGLPAEARMVLVNYPDGTNSIISYRKFLTIKRNLPKDTQYMVIPRFFSRHQ